MKCLRCYGTKPRSITPAEEILTLSHAHIYLRTRKYVAGSCCGRQEEEAVSKTWEEGGAALLFPASEEEH